MRNALTLALLAGAAALTQPALAQEAGTIQIKVLGTAVLPDGKITAINLNTPGLPATLQTKANDNYVPTLAIEYFITPNVSVETICCMTQHDVDGTTGLPGAELVADAKLIPATLTAKYHFNAGGVSPYIGAGPAYFLWVKDKPGAAAVALGVNGFGLSDELGLALQAGIDVPLNPKMAISLDAKRYFISTTATWSVNGTPVIQTEHKLDPWVLSAGLGVKF
jgi:outer membrane protein